MNNSTSANGSEDFEEFSTFASLSDCSSCEFYTPSDPPCNVNPTYTGEDICDSFTPRVGSILLDNYPWLKDLIDFNIQDI